MRLWIAALICVLIVPRPGRAQMLTGQVLEGSLEREITDAAITLLHPDGRALGDPVLSGPEGRFALPTPGPGEYYLRAEKLGYLAIVDGIFAFESEEARLNVEIYMAPQPVDLAGIEVLVEMRRIRRNLRNSGFYEREAQGWGYFVSPEKILNTEVVNVSDHLRQVPGIRFQDGRVLFRAPPNPRGVAPLCEPNVFLDGMRLINGSETLNGPVSGQGLDDRVRPEEVAAIEVYRRRTQVPLQYYAGSPDFPFCGTIIVWTKSGR